MQVPNGAWSSDLICAVVSGGTRSRSSSVSRCSAGVVYKGATLLLQLGIAWVYETLSVARGGRTGDMDCVELSGNRHTFIRISRGVVTRNTATTRP